MHREIYAHNCPTRCNYIQFIYICKPLYMFRVVTPIIITSSCHCIHSISCRERDWTGTQFTTGCNYGFTNIYIYVYIYIHTYIYTHIYISRTVYIYIYIYIYIYAHTNLFNLSVKSHHVETGVAPSNGKSCRSLSNTMRRVGNIWTTAIWDGHGGDYVLGCDAV